MNIFKAKKKAVKGKIIELAFDETGRNALAFGLQWRSIVTTDTRKAGTVMARAQGATHFIFKGQQIGFGTIDAKIAPQYSSISTIYPAAVVAARQYGGDAIFLLNIGDGEYWVSLIRNGLPTSTDKILQNSDQLQAIDQVKALAESLVAESVNFSVYTNLHDHGLQGTIKSTSLEDILAAATNDDDRLTTVPKTQTSIPLPVLAVLILGILTLLGQHAYKLWEAKKRAEAAAAELAAKNSIEKENPTLLWDRAIDNWSSTKVALSKSSTAEGIGKARDSLGRLPILWDGWTLRTANCMATPLVSKAKSRTWNCAANYERLPGGKLNRDMEPLIPKNWNPAFKPLHNMGFSWSLEQTVAAIDIKTLDSLKFHNIQTASKLQVLAPAISTEASLVFTPVSIAPPVAADGTTIPPETTTPVFTESALNLAGPLRTIDVLIESDIPADWLSIAINYTGTTGIAIPTIKSSAITADITGVIYAKN